MKMLISIFLLSIGFDCFAFNPCSLNIGIEDIQAAAKNALIKKGYTIQKWNANLNFTMNVESKSYTVQGSGFYPGEGWDVPARAVYNDVTDYYASAEIDSRYNVYAATKKFVSDSREVAEKKAVKRLPSCKKLLRLYPELAEDL
jgi:hypothetical protein